MQTKTKIKYYCTEPIRMPMILKKVKEIGKDTEKLEHLHHATVENSLAVPQWANKKHQFLSLYPKELKTGTQVDICTP